MVHDATPVGLGGVEVRFDDDRAVADAGIVLAATLAERLGVEALVDETVDSGGRAGAANAGAKVMTLGDGARGGLDLLDPGTAVRAGHRMYAASRPAPQATTCQRRSLSAASTDERPRQYGRHQQHPKRDG
jgi:hypothetical protein